MPYTLYEICPAPPELEINGSEIGLTNLTLDVEIKLNKKFGSLAGVFDFFNNENASCYVLVWFLVADKARFNYSKEEFIKFCQTTDISGNVIKLRDAFIEAVNNSMPLEKYRKREKEIEDIKKAQVDKGSICYAKYFDTIAARYSFTFSDFLACTLRQVHIMLKTIDESQYEELEIQAALANRQLKPRMTPIMVTEEEEIQQEEDAKELLARLQKQYEEKQGKK